MDDLDCIIVLIISSVCNPLGKELEFTLGQIFLAGQLVTDRCEVNENIVLGWNDVLSSEVTLEHLGHFFGVIGLRSKVKIKVLSSRLNDDDNVVVETVTLGNQVIVTSAVSGGTIWDLGRSGKAVLAVPVSCIGCWHFAVESLDFDSLLFRDLGHLVFGGAELSV